MRLEQLVLFGPGDDLRIRFGPNLTVLAGLDEDGRNELLDTVARTLTGRMPNASVIYTDDAERRTFADRTGATFADTGQAAPGLPDSFGTDPDLVHDLLVLRPSEVGLSRGPSTAELERRAERARAAVAEALERRREALAVDAEVQRLRATIDRLETALDHHEDDVAHWRWLEARRNLDLERASLAALDDHTVGAADERLLAAVDQLRTSGQVWAESGSEAAELHERVGPPPEVSQTDLVRVSSTPVAAPVGFDDRLGVWQRAQEELRRRQAELEAAEAPVPPADDPQVEQLAALDQDLLWQTLARLDEAEEAYTAATAAQEDTLDPAHEAAIEASHQEVVRCQRDVDRTFLPGALGTALVALGALVAGTELSLVVGVVMLLAAVGLAAWLLVLPRRALAAAHQEEDRVLASADAGTWLGMHLRRIDDVMSSTGRTTVAAALHHVTKARLDWTELAGEVPPGVAVERRAAVDARAELLSPDARSRRIATARAAVDEARGAVGSARLQATHDLGPFGLGAEAGSDLEPFQLGELLNARIRAGAVARDVLKVQELTQRAAVAAERLDTLLRQLGFDEGDLGVRLDRAIAAVEAARRRTDEADTRTRTERQADLRAAAEQLKATWRPAWSGRPEPVEEPVDRTTLLERHRAAADELAKLHPPQLAEIERHLALLEGRLEEITQQLDAASGGAGSPWDRLRRRIARTTEIDGVAVRVPVFVDASTVELEAAERLQLLDHLEELATTAQIIVLADEELISRWARSRADCGLVTLYETAAA